MPHERQVYLGDGAYARWDSDTRQVVLTADSDEHINTIYLDAEVIVSLLNYLKSQFPDAPHWGK